MTLQEPLARLKPVSSITRTWPALCNPRQRRAGQLLIRKRAWGVILYASVKKSYDANHAEILIRRMIFRARKNLQLSLVAGARKQRFLRLAQRHVPKLARNNHYSL
ncbi:hypothetical protein [Rhizobium mongolense]|uniref:Uncharacterized protein n=1 Tax=Rhizobium mongolense TaxID=57676 RepID=A0A7W6RRS4_9HYPH|nr:hypothetical protein [Rhizobium mongolense]MBB4277407.1 hypothetical protein [Rhizobium mongolense]